MYDLLPTDKKIQMTALSFPAKNLVHRLNQRLKPQQAVPKSVLKHLNKN